MKEINNLKNILGDYSKKMNKEEKSNYLSIRRKIVANKNLKKGYKIKKNDLLIVRSQEEGILISEYDKVVGKKLINNINKFDNFLFKNLI